MTYDPRTAPRYLGEDVDVAALERANGLLLTDLAALQQVLDVFAEDGWSHIVATLEAEVSRAKDELAMKSFTTDQVAHVQGQIRAFEFLLGLPKRAGAQFKTLTGKQRDIERRISGSTEEEEIIEHT